MNNPLSDAIGIMKKDWKLLAGLNALYLCVLVVGAVLALISPGLQLSMVRYVGAETIGGPLTNPSGVTDALAVMAGGLVSSFLLNTLGMITIPSAVLPIWGPIIGGARFFIWGVAYVLPLEGVMTPGELIPQYLAIILEGEAYIIAIFACVRQLSVAAGHMEAGYQWMLKMYGAAVLENLKLLAVVLVLLTASAIYQAFVIPVLNGML
ncbi:hypothetical protein MCP_2577 [Methanocella paludicola SANAE]|uniref:Yip1 domain-containing protein n=1 Tax=Methanocella paludicola (strain DSM 17711 / JCM 13418 / NBRC 101707 / SANAE) TaxID=304371 RepID=D1Z1S7_METPS|nr:hypothetical protein [Methanocella paludicola]BAI62649.1 hypothetical protein MCP_2577 [Methanocella paludicola SANAE]